MKKTTTLFLSILLLAVAGSLFVAPKVFSLNWGLQNVCQPGTDSKDHFPYGFICSGDPLDYKNDWMTATVNGQTYNSNRNNPQTIRILQGSTDHIDFTSNYNASDKARTKPATAPGAGSDNPGVLVWTTIDIRDELFNGLTNITSNGTRKMCPGVTTGQSGYSGTPRVYNFRDDAANTKPNGVNASPYAYTSGPPGGSGYEDCGTQGRMIYWTKGGSGDFSEGFTLKLDTSKTGGFCLRNNVSVSYGGAQWPSSTGVYVDEGNTASRIAKQSVPNGQCFEVYNNPVHGTINFLRCSSYSVSGYDEDDPAAPVKFRIIHQNASGGTYSTDIPTNPATDIYTGYGDTSQRGGKFQAGISYILEIQDLNSGQWIRGPSASTVSGSCGAKTQCNHLEVPNEGTYNPPGGLNQSYTAITYVTVTDSAGNTLVNHDIITGSDKGKYDYTPLGKSITIRIQRQYKNTSTNPDTWVNYSDPDNGYPTWYTGVPDPKNNSHPFENDHVIDCYQASCSVSVSGDSTYGGRILPGANVYVTVNITNTGGADQLDLPANLPEGGSGNELVVINGSTPYVLGYGIDKGDPAAQYTFVTTAPANGDSATISPSVQYWGRFGLADCGDSPYPIYREFAISAHSEGDYDDIEDPSVFNYHNKISKTIDATITVNTKACVYKEPVANPSDPCQPGVAVGPATGGTYTLRDTDIYAPTPYPVPGPITAGLTYCAYTWVEHSKGLYSPGQTPYLFGGPSVDPKCKTVHNEPYVHTTGADVINGVGFGLGSCSAPDPASNEAKLRTYTKTTGTKPRGSGSQFAAMSIGDIEGFSSANIRSSFNPTGTSGLSFANSTSNAPNNGNKVAHNLITGGKYGISDRCVMPDYYAKMPSGATDWGGGQDLSQTGTHAYKNTDPAVPVTIAGPGNSTIQISDGANNALYAAGDVIINSSIRYQHTTGVGNHWNHVSDIPSLIIVAKGNIYIDPSVTQLDGVFIAQGTGNTKGEFNTCQTKTFDGCKNQLVVNGSVLARKVLLNRTYSSLRYAQQGESMPYGSSHSCNGSIDTPPGKTTEKDCAAEIFNFSPEVYLVQPAMTPNSQGNFQTFTSLSPVL